MLSPLAALIRPRFYLIFVVCSHLAFSQDETYTTLTARQQVILRENSEWARQQPYVVLLSLDGFRYDYAEKYQASHILKLASQGVSATRMLPSYPTKTFPNHYTLVTGLYPANHGLVSNEFYSREKSGWYSYRNKEVVQDGSWYQGVPIWSLAEQQGMLSASFFWVGSEAEIAGQRPSYTYAYDGSVPNHLRVRQMVDWLKLPEAQRPHVILGYFSLVDDMGHRYGPDHPETKKAVLHLDSLVGLMMDEIAALDLPIHLVLVSDHGMSAISRGVVLPDLVDLGDSEVSYSFPPMIYQEDPEKVERIYQALLASGEVDVYKRENIPNYINFENPDRVGDLVLSTDPPLVVLEKPRVVSGGTHGFDPFAHQEMAAIFYADGPLLQDGLVIPPFENIHLYPFLARLLGLKISEPIDGKEAVLEVLLR